MVDLEKASECLAFFVKRHSGRINRTTLLKLLYLTDVLAQLRQGRSVTGAQYISYDHGPWFVEFYQALERAPNVAERQSLTVFGDRQYLYAGTGDFQPAALSSDEIGFLEEVDARWGTKPLRHILNHIYGRPPFLGTSYGETVDLAKATAESV